MKKRLLILLALGAAAIFSACSGGGDADLISVTNSGKLTVLQDLTFDWGDIDINGGNVEQVFKLKNDGPDDLIIKTANTSCMCTTATVQVGEAISPSFGMSMHGSANPLWGFAVKPGEEFSVKVIFDPLAHGPEGVGTIQRNVTLFTSSISNGNYAKITPQSGNDAITEFVLNGNVLKSDEYKEKHKDTAFFLMKPSLIWG